MGAAVAGIRAAASSLDPPGASSRPSDSAFAFALARIWEVADGSPSASRAASAGGRTIKGTGGSMASVARVHHSSWSPIAAVAALLLSLATSVSRAQVSAANLPYSGISPGGVDMQTGEIIVVARPDLALGGPLPVV